MILIAAIVIGALAAYAVVVYVGGVEDRANGNACLLYTSDAADE